MALMSRVRRHRHAHLPPAARPRTRRSRLRRFLRARTGTGESEYASVAVQRYHSGIAPRNVPCEPDAWRIRCAPRVGAVANCVSSRQEEVLPDANSLVVCLCGSDRRTDCRMWQPAATTAPTTPATGTPAATTAPATTDSHDRTDGDNGRDDRYHNGPEDDNRRPRRRPRRRLRRRQHGVTVAPSAWTDRRRDRRRTIDDKNFNEYSYQGRQARRHSIGAPDRPFVVPASATDYAPYIQTSSIRAPTSSSPSASTSPPTPWPPRWRTRTSGSSASTRAVRR